MRTGSRLQFTFLRLGLILLILSGLRITDAEGLNAWHYSAVDDLKQLGDAEFSGGNTRYTPDLALTDNIWASPDIETQRLFNTSLDEVFLQITFKPGVVPHIDKLLEIRYGSGSEVLLKPGNQPLFSKVVGQDLLIWYGFQDSPNYTGPTITSNSKWTFNVEGDHPVAQVFFFVSSHQNGAQEMPDLFPLDYNHLYEIPKDTSYLFTETTNGYAQGKPVRSAEKLIVLVHGWNPDAYRNKFAPDDLPHAPELEPRWATLAKNLIENPIVRRFGWTISRYDWSRDAATGGSRPLANSFPAILNHGNASRDAGSAHGAKLAKLIGQTGATHVQFIAHSSGSWVARRAAAFLKHRNPAIRIQITALDANVNDEDPPNYDEHINLQPAFELTSLWADYRESYYVVDDLGTVSKSDTLGWTSGSFTGWINHDIEWLGQSGLYLPWMKDHAGPISWYSSTADRANLSNTALLSPPGALNLGFLGSLPVRFASEVNDNFPGATLAGPSGSALWYTYQASSQSAEPAHDPQSRAWRSVWGKWTAPASGAVTFSTAGADFYNVLAAYRARTSTIGELSVPEDKELVVAASAGHSVSRLTPLARDSSGGKGPGQCAISFNAVAGQTYYIAVDGVLGQAGTSPLTWTMSGQNNPPQPLRSSVPPLDRFCKAQP